MARHATLARWAAVGELVPCGHVCSTLCAVVSKYHLDVQNYSI
jgi:hypothetical protein